MKKLIVGLLMLFMVSGCGAGLTYDLLTHDNVIAAAVEAKKGVEAFNTTVIADTVVRREYMLQAVGDGIKELAQAQAIDAEQAKALAQSVVAGLKVHLANYAEQERRRTQLYEVTIDNLNYIIQISKQGKSYSLYRADIGIQWKQYLESSARDAIGSID
jgi:hypothetical protein